MEVRPAGDPDELIRLSVKVTREQHAWLEAERRRCEDRSIAPVIRRAIRALMAEDERLGVMS